MALSNNQYDVTQLGKVDENGFTAALFPQIKDALAKKMQEIYGYDIDISSASADGQYVMMESLILNNIYRTIESLSDNLSPASASGKYLDILASLSGAFRKDATYSTATVYIANSGPDAVTPSYLILMDKNGNRWQWMNPVDLNGQYKVTFPAKNGDNYTLIPITVTCTELGPISAIGANLTDTFATQTDYNRIMNTAPLSRGGEIYATTGAGTLQVFQNDNAVVGQSTETDASLKARRVRSLGQSGRTVIDTLVANLLNIPGIIDAWVYSNNTNAEQLGVFDAGDTAGSGIPAHSVYVVTCSQKGIAVPDSTIAETIYNVITPGISTWAPNEPLSGTKKTYTIPVTEAMSNVVAWKSVNFFTATIHISMTYQNGVKTSTDAQKDAIRTAIMNYMNNIAISEPFNENILRQIIENADFRTGKYGLPTYEINTITVDSMPPASKLYRFYYAPENIKIEDSTSGTTYKCTITLGSTT